MTDYDNTFNGAVFPTKEHGVMTGIIELDDGREHRAALIKDGCGTGVHRVEVRRRRKDKKPGKLLALGQVRRNRSKNANAPIAIGWLSAKKNKRIDICMWLREDIAGRYYQIKPDELRAQLAEPFIEEAAS